MKNLLDKISPNEALNILNILAETDKDIKKGFMNCCTKIAHGIKYMTCT